MTTIMRKVALTVCLALLPMLCIGASRQEFKQIHMTKSCNKTHTGVISARYETNYGLTYENLMDCYSRLVAPANRMFLIQYGRFELEESLGADCVDAYNLYDGEDVYNTSFHSGSMCGTHDSLGNFMTTSQYLFITMETDNTAVARGVEMIITSFYEEPCGAEDFRCNNSICIDSRLECDHINHCSDNSDESHCTAEDLNPSARDSTLFIAIGSGLVGLILILILVIVAFKVYQYYKWKKIMEEDFDNDTFESGDLYKYPVTDVYSKYDVGSKGRREPADDYMIKAGSSEDSHDNQAFENDE